MTKDTPKSKTMAQDARTVQHLNEGLTTAHLAKGLTVGHIAHTMGNVSTGTQTAGNVQPAPSNGVNAGTTNNSNKK